MVTTQAGDARLAAWWAFMAAHALLMQRVGRNLAAGTSLPPSSCNVLSLAPRTPGRPRPAERPGQSRTSHPEWRDSVGEPAGEGGVVAPGGARAVPARIVRDPDGSGAGRLRQARAVFEEYV